jgi:hypothetical protein
MTVANMLKHSRKMVGNVHITLYCGIFRSFISFLHISVENFDESTSAVKRDEY